MSLSSGELLDLVSAALEVAAPALSVEQRALVGQVLDGLLRESSAASAVTSRPVVGAAT